MKFKNKKKQDKGIASAVAAVIAVATVLSAIVATILPLLLLQVHIVKVVVFDYNYNNAQQALQSLMSSENTMLTPYGQFEDRRASKIVGEYLTVGRSQNDLEFLRESLQKMTEKVDNINLFECFELTSGSTRLVSPKRCNGRLPTEHRGNIFITTPSGVAEVQLTIE